MNVFDRFAPREDGTDEGGPETNLANLILEKISAHETAKGQRIEEPVIHGGGAPENAVELNPKIIQVYSTCDALFIPLLKSSLMLEQNWTSVVEV